MNMDNKGQVGVIVAILVVSLLVAVLVIIQTVYVPQWMKDREAEHMDNVANQFADLKYSLDLQASQRSLSPLINSITLGSKELPFFVSSRAFGSLYIVGEDTSNFSVTFGGTGRVLQEVENSFPITGNSAEIEYMDSISSLFLHITTLEAGKYFNISSDLFNITFYVFSSSYGLQINMTLVYSGSTLFNQPVATALQEGIDYRINLLNPDYRFSTSVLPEIEKPFNLTINVTGNGKFEISGYMYGNEGAINTMEYTYRMGEIVYSSQNAYFVDQDYIYEGGAVILYQRNGNNILYPPIMSIEEGTIPHINFTFVDINGIAGKTGAAGYGTYSIRSNYSSSTSIKFMGDITMEIYTKYPDSWKNYMETLLDENGINATVTKSDDKISIAFNDVKISFTKVVVSAQIGPGWVV